jgi:hypothetical protein
MRKVIFVCINCRERHEVDELSPEEAAEFRRRGIPTGHPTCRRCGRLMIQES